MARQLASDPSLRGSMSADSWIVLSCQSGEPRDGPFRQRPPAIPPVPAISRLIIGVIPLALLFRARPGRELVKTRVEFLGRGVKPPIKGLDINPGKPGPVFKARCLH